MKGPLRKKVVPIAAAVLFVLAAVAGAAELILSKGEDLRSALRRALRSCSSCSCW